MATLPTGVAPGLLDLARSKLAEIAQLERTGPPPPRRGPRPSLAEALRAGAARRGLGVIAEYKRASPSLGDIDLITTPEVAAASLDEADGLSVLTEAERFKGDLSFIERAAAFPGPILRKDFIFDPYQLIATAATRAAAALLIVSLTPDVDLLADLVALATELNLEAVVEVFDPGELITARRAGAAIIQVNSRNLGDLSVDPDRALRLAKDEPPLPSETWIAASGMKTSGDLRRAAEMGYHGALVGTSIMRATDKRAALAALMDGLSEGRP